MKMILLLVRDSPTLIFEPYTVPVVEDGVAKEIIYKTNSDQELEDKLKELIEIYPKHKIYPVSDLGWMVDVVVGDQ